MHEFSVAQDVVDIVRESASGKRVRKISLRIGAVSGIHEEALLFALEHVLKESDMTSVTVETEKEPVSFQCDCGRLYAPEGLDSPCPQCGGFQRRVVAGGDLTVESIEVLE